MSLGQQSSWFTYAINISRLYNIEATELIEAPWNRNAWKNYLQTTIYGKWRQRLLEGKAHKHSLIMLDSTGTSPHPLWTSGMQNARITTAANVRARMITGCYQNMSKTSKWDKTGNATCQICNEEPEDNCHILLRCSGLEAERRKGLDTLMGLGYNVPGRGQDALQILLNGPNREEEFYPPKKWQLIHHTISNFCHKIHVIRHEKLNKNPKAQNNKNKNTKTKGRDGGGGHGGGGSSDGRYGGGAKSGKGGGNRT